MTANGLSVPLTALARRIDSATTLSEVKAPERMPEAISVAGRSRGWKAVEVKGADGVSFVIVVSA
jgi:hypothetical protein